MLSDQQFLLMLGREGAPKLLKAPTWAVVCCAAGEKAAERFGRGAGARPVHVLLHSLQRLLQRSF